MGGRLGIIFSACMVVLGAWGVVMLVLLGVFTRVNAVTFVEDVPIDMAEWESMKFAPSYIDEKYAMVSTNCFIASGFYLILLIFGAIKLHVATRHRHVAC